MHIVQRILKAFFVVNYIPLLLAASDIQARLRLLVAALSRHERMRCEVGLYDT
jgi:hypothetical protein